jgi:hypothetical protein
MSISLIFVILTICAVDATYLPSFKLKFKHAAASFIAITAFQSPMPTTSPFPSFHTQAVQAAVNPLADVGMIIYIYVYIYIYLFIRISTYT